MNLSNARNHLDTWLGNHPNAHQDQCVSVRVLRDNLDAVLRRDTVAARARATGALCRAERAFGL